jgi:hypothetical protein
VPAINSIVPMSHPPSSQCLQLDPLLKDHFRPDSYASMHFSLFSVWLFSYQIAALGTSTQITTQCFTKMNTKSIKSVPTSSKTVTVVKLPTVVISTTRSTLTYTPAVTTTTLTESVTMTSTTTDSAVTGKSISLVGTSRISRI